MLDEINKPKIRHYYNQLDSHCWRYFMVKYNTDYTTLSRLRIMLSNINTPIVK